MFCRVPLVRTYSHPSQNTYDQNRVTDHIFSVSISSDLLLPLPVSISVSSCLRKRYGIGQYLGFGHMVAELPKEEVVPFLRMKMWDSGVLLDRNDLTGPGAWDEAYWKGTKDASQAPQSPGSRNKARGVSRPSP